MAEEAEAVVAAADGDPYFLTSTVPFCQDAATARGSSTQTVISVQKENSMISQKTTRVIGLTLVGACGVGILAAWAAQPPIIPVWEHGELRVAQTGVHVRFTRADGSEVLYPPDEICRSAVRSKLYYLDGLTAAGWELLEVDQSEQDWVFLMRRAHHLP